MEPIAAADTPIARGPDAPAPASDRDHARPGWVTGWVRRLWLTDAMAQARAGFAGVIRTDPDAIRARSTAAAARVAARTARDALDPAGDAPARDAATTRAVAAAALYRDAIAAGLRAITAGERRARPRSPIEALASLPPAWWPALARGVDPSAVRDAIADDDDDDDDRARARAWDHLAVLERFAAGVLAALEPRAQRVARVWGQRVARVALLGVVAPLAAEFTFGALLYPDLAAGASWRASSAESDFRASGRGYAIELNAPYLFFHTAIQTNPWVEFDLGAPRPLHQIVVMNRHDCCGERAVPLVVELSDDARTWREVARRTDVFTTWPVRLSRARARHVRLRVPRETALHLERVEIR